MTKKLPGDIVDIELSDDRIRLCKRLTLTAAEAEKKIAAMTYGGNTLVRDEACEKAFLPPLVTVFYKYVFLMNVLPDESQLMAAYIEACFDRHSELELLPKKIYVPAERSVPLPLSEAGIRARMLRAYPSLIRDFHFFLLCRESGLFEEVKYSVRIDYFEGYDLVVRYNGVYFYIKLYVSTYRGEYFKNAKHRRREYGGKARSIELTIDLNKRQKKGNFFLYDGEDVRKLFEQCKQSIQAKS